MFLRIIQMQRVSADGWPSDVLHVSTNWICDRPLIDVVLQAGTHVIASQDFRGSTVRWTSTSASRTRASTEEHAQTSSMHTTALALQASIEIILFQISYINYTVYIIIYCMTFFSCIHGISHCSNFNSMLHSQTCNNHSASFDLGLVIKKKIN